MKRILLALTFGFIMFHLNAQTVNVNTSSSSPASPLECNDFLVTVNGVVNCNNFLFDSTSFTISGSNIEVGVYYTGSIICTGALSPYSYTQNLGNIPAGTYSITIKGFLNLNVDDNLSAPSVTIGSCCPVTASYTSDLNVGCTADNTPITFTNTSTGATSSEWFINNISAGTGNSLVLPTNTIGAYDVKLVSTDGSCSDSLTQTYNVFTNPVVDLGPDTTSCIGQTVNLNAGAGFSIYEWTNNSSNAATASITSDNTYKVTVTDANGCSATDSIVATFATPPSISLGNDIAICAEDSLILDPGMFSSYNWNTGETSQTIMVINSFNYGVTVTDSNGCSATDNISVLVNPTPNVNIGQDTIEICDGNTSTLNAGNFTSYLWSTAETTNAISVETQGSVNVVVTDANGCKNSDETYIKVNALPNVNFGADTISFCAGNSATLTPGTFSTYAWSNSENSATIDVSSQGEYSVTVTDLEGCSNMGSVYAKQNANPIVGLGEDKDLCTTDKLTLTGGTFSSYFWNDGSALETLVVNGGDYSLGNNTFDLNVTDENGCNGSDEIVINVKECDVAISSIRLENKISIFPIPAKNTLNIQTDKIVKSHIKIFSVLGKEVIDLNAQTLKSKSIIDISNLNEGIYFIEISTENERLVKQFVKVK